VHAAPGTPALIKPRCLLRDHGTCGPTSLSRRSTIGGSGAGRWPTGGSRFEASCEEFAAAGFLIERMHEPQPSAELRERTGSGWAGRSVQIKHVDGAVALGAHHELPVVRGDGDLAGRGVEERQGRVGQAERPHRARHRGEPAVHLPVASDAPGAAAFDHVHQPCPAVTETGNCPPEPTTWIRYSQGSAGVSGPACGLVLVESGGCRGQVWAEDLTAARPGNWEPAGRARRIDQ
jgi:hypothetical protein